MKRYNTTAIGTLLLIAVGLLTRLGHAAQTVLYGSDTSCMGNVWVTGTSKGNGNACDDGWGLTQANAICRSLGSTAVAATTGSAFGRNSLDFVAENIVCPSSATSINDCTYITERQFDDDTCFYSAGVVCSSCLSGTEGEVRLVGGRTPCEGYVMVYHSGQWGYLDSDEMSRRVANAVCVSAGYTEADYYDTYSSRTTTFGSGATSFFNRFSVTNIQCGSSSGIPLTSCSYITDNGAFSGSGLAKVACRGGAFCTYNSWNPLGYYSGNQYSGGVYIDGQIVGGVRDDDNYLYIYIPVVVVFVLIVLSCTCMVRRRRLRMLAAGNAAAAVSAGSYAMKAFGTTTATAFVGGGHQQIMLTAQPAGGAQAASLPTAIPQVGMVPSPSVEVTTANSSSPSAAVTMNNPYATVHSPPQVYSQYLPDTDNVTL